MPLNPCLVAPLLIWVQIMLAPLLLWLRNPHYYILIQILYLTQLSQIQPNFTPLISTNLNSSYICVYSSSTKDSLKIFFIIQIPFFLFYQKCILHFIQPSVHPISKMDYFLQLLSKTILTKILFEMLRPPTA